MPQCTATTYTAAVQQRGMILALWGLITASRIPLSVMLPNCYPTYAIPETCATDSEPSRERRGLHAPHSTHNSVFLFVGLQSFPLNFTLASCLGILHAVSCEMRRKFLQCKPNRATVDHNMEAERIRTHTCSLDSLMEPNVGLIYNDHGTAPIRALIAAPQLVPPFVTATKNVDDAPPEHPVLL